MTRSTTISPTLGALCVFICSLGVSAAAQAGPGEVESLQTNIPLVSGSEIDPTTDPGAALSADADSGSGEPSITAPALPPRSNQAQREAQSDRPLGLRLPEGVWRTVGALGVVIGLIVLLRTIMTRFGGPLAKARAPSGIIEVLGRFPLARGQTLLLIKIDRRVLLLGQTAQGLTTLSELSDAEQVASLLQRVRNDRGDSFSKQFERLITPVGAEQASTGPTPVVIDLTRSKKASAAQSVASMLADGARR